MRTAVQASAKMATSAARKILSPRRLCLFGILERKSLSISTSNATYRNHHIPRLVSNSSTDSTPHTYHFASRSSSQQYTNGIGWSLGLMQRSLSTTSETPRWPIPCWKCGTETKHLFFCEKCGIIQSTRKDANYFEVLGFPTKFGLDTKQLTQNFRQLQRQLHPDRFTQKSKEEQAFSDDQSSLVNKSYQTLLKPLPRGLYLLELHGASLEEGEVHLDPVFLMEIMETNEDLAGTNNIDVVRTIGAENHKTLLTLMSLAADAFAEGDIGEAKSTLARLKYYANIDDKVSDFESKFAEKL